MSMTLTDKINLWFAYHPKTTIAVTYLLAFVGPFYIFLEDVLRDTKGYAQELKADIPDYYENFPQKLKDLPKDVRESCEQVRTAHKKKGTRQ
ncbi:hypothetical protein [Corynebacterium glutamicum]|uniref:hypothetical protein n=1 Tax=Corynebacterium glutamicum TaxID=1718 RepID=UPI001B8CCC4A|nr:hypothetical protein [Corynebacterium glutamicum]